MSRKIIKANVRPSVLTWARESIGMPKKEAAKKLKIEQATLTSWEEGGSKPNLTELELISKVYKRPIALLFLPEPPPEKKVPKDFRFLPGDKKKTLTIKTLLAIREARRLQALAAEMVRRTGGQADIDLIRIRLKTNIEETALAIRDYLGIDERKRLSWPSSDDAFDCWKTAIEKKGVLVFQINASINDFRGFTLIDDKPPVIVINRRDPVNAKIFSLIHEFAHVLLHVSAITGYNEPAGSDRANTINTATLVEQFCNRLSAAILIPERFLRETEPYLHTDPPERELTRLATKFKTSKETMLRRLLTLKYATPNYYERKREEWLKKYEEAEKKKRGGRRNPPKACVEEKGLPYIKLVLDNYLTDRITSVEAAKYLGLKFKYIPEVETIIKKRVETL